jgi:hypothetical protein
LQGKKLAVLGWTHRNEILHLTLVFPDGSRSIIPASWTDLSGQKPKSLASADSHPTSNVIATIPHLLHARKIVDALLCRLNYSEEERKRAQAIGSVAHIAGPVTALKDLENTNPSTKTKRHNHSGRPDQQNGLYRGHRPGSGGKP